MKPPRPCLDCGRATTATPAYCPECKPQVYAGAWRTISENLRREWIAEHGPLCPGYKREPHLVAVTDLTVDHVVAGDPRQLQILCRSCNSTKSNVER